MGWNRICVSTELNVWDTLEDIDIDFIKEYLELKENINEERRKEFRFYQFETDVDIDSDYVLSEMWDSDIKREAENRGFNIDEDDDDDFYDEEWEELANSVSKLSHYEMSRFFKEFMKEKRIYTKEELKGFIDDII